MHETPAAHFVRRGFHASCGKFSELYPVGPLPPRGSQGIWSGRRLGYELGLRILNGWVSLLKEQALLVTITLGLEFPPTSKKPPELLLWRPFV